MIKNKYIIKVNGVTTLKQALELDKSGVDLIGIPIWNDKLYDNGPYGNIKMVERETIVDMMKYINKSKLVGCFWSRISEEEAMIQYIDNLDLEYVQQQAPNNLSNETLEYLYNKNKKLTFGNIDVTYDTDPSWIVSPYLSGEYTFATFYEINLLGNVTNSRNFFKQSSLEYSDELQIEDINALGRIYPIMISLDFDENNILEILERIPNIRGITLTINNNDLVNMHDVQVESYEKILKFLKYLQNLTI